jgi:hypothetical protein
VRAALRDKRRAAAIAREVCCALESAGDMDGASEAWRQHRLRVAERLNVPVPGGVFRCQDGTVYGVAFDGSIHVARDENGKRLRPPSKRSPFVAPDQSEGREVVDHPVLESNRKEILAPDVFVTSRISDTSSGRGVTGSDLDSRKLLVSQDGEVTRTRRTDGAEDLIAASEEIHGNGQLGDGADRLSREPARGIGGTVTALPPEPPA